MDFFGCRGFKRMGEYHFFKDSAELCGLHRYAINHCNKIIFDAPIEAIRVIPASWESYTRQEVDMSSRKRAIKHFSQIGLRGKRQTGTHTVRSTKKSSMADITTRRVKSTKSFPTRRTKSSSWSAR